MNTATQTLQTVKTYIIVHQRNIVLWSVTVLVAAFLGSLFIYSMTPHYTYQPVKACDLLTPAKAQDMLGDHVLSVDTKDPVVSGDTATSKCSYTDANADSSKLKVAAVAVRSAVEDKGIQQNKTDFVQARSNNDVEVVKGVGDSAYFNKANGQLNILDGGNWIILNYGTGSAPQTNTVDDAVKLAHKVLRS